MLQGDFKFSSISVKTCQFFVLLNVLFDYKPVVTLCLFACLSRHHSKGQHSVTDVSRASTSKLGLQKEQLVPPPRGAEAELDFSLTLQLCRPD